MTVSSKHPDVLVWRNGNWGYMYHRNFFTNMLRQHIRKIDGFKNKRTEELLIKACLAAGQMVKVNGASFRLKHEGHKHVEQIGNQTNTSTSGDSVAR